MHAFPMIELEKGWEKWEPENQAKVGEYRSPEGELYIPGVAVQRSLVDAAVFSKGKGRASLQKQVAACVQVNPVQLVITPQDYVIDSRPVVIKATQGRIMRHRPKFEDWSVAFTLEYDKALLSEKELRGIVDDAWYPCGLLDFRPAKKGPFGRFMVTEWKV